MKTEAQAQLEQRLADLKNLGFKILPDGDYQEPFSEYLVTRREIDNFSHSEWDSLTEFVDYILTK